MNRKTPDERRRSQLAAIHVAAHTLGMDDNTYRALVERVSGQHGTPQRSAGKCDPRQLTAIADELRALGGMPDRVRYPGRPRGALSPQLRKIEALIADAGRPWAYAHAVGKRICRVERIDWCTTEQLGKVIAALQIDDNRRKR